MRRGPLVAAGALVLLFALITLLEVQSPRVEVASEAARDTLGAPPGIREFWETYREAARHRAAGRTAEARDAYRRALELNPQHEDALYYLGNMALELSHYAEAEAAWERLVAVNARSSRAHSRLGDLYACSDPGAPRDLARAETEFRRALELNREETGPLLHLGELALIRGNLTDAISYLDAVIGSHRGSVEAHFLKGYAAWKQARPELASTLFHQAVALARPADAVQHLPGEGDTKRGLAPAVAPTSRCRTFEAQIERLSTLDSPSLSTQMHELYQQLDGRLADLAPRAPS